MLKLALEAQWVRTGCAQAGHLAGWKQSGDAAVDGKAGRRVVAPLPPLSRRPLYRNKRYGLPKKPRRARKPSRSTAIAKTKATSPLPPSWGDHGLF